MRLPSPRTRGGIPLYDVLAGRRTVRAYDASAPLSLRAASQLLWAAQGATSAEGYRTAPSAGPVYPFETFLVAGDVESLEPGVYRYLPPDHAVARTALGDKRADVIAVSFNHDWMATCPAYIVLGMIVARMAPKYGAAGERFALLEAGHIAQNLLLAAESMGLGAAPICAYDGAGLKGALGLDDEIDPVYLITVGSRTETEGERR
jgi:SagB-type dehydrogenase family enzyme